MLDDIPQRDDVEVLGGQRRALQGPGDDVQAKLAPRVVGRPLRELDALHLVVPLRFGKKEAGCAADVEPAAAPRHARWQHAQCPQLASRLGAARGLLAGVVGKHGVVPAGVVALAVELLEVDAGRVGADIDQAARGAAHHVEVVAAKGELGRWRAAHRAVAVARQCPRRDGRVVQLDHAAASCVACASAATTRSWSASLRSALMGRLSTCAAAQSLCGNWRPAACVA